MMWHNSRMVQIERLRLGTWVLVGRRKLRNHATGPTKKQWNEDRINPLSFGFCVLLFSVSGDHKRDMFSSHLLHCCIVKIFSPIFKLSSSGHKPVWSSQIRLICSQTTIIRPAHIQN